MSNDLATLIARVEAAEVASVDLFYAVASAILPDTFPSLIDHDHERVCWRVNVFGKFVGAGAWTDAALALVERCLPGWAWQVERFSLGRVPGAQLAEPVQTSYGPGIGVRAQAKAATPALALILALLKALEARSEQAEGEA